jgi:hypothetical protein
LTRSFALAFVLATVTATAALAQTQPQQPAAPAAGAPDTAQRFQAYVTSEGYKKTISQLATFGDTVSDPACKEHKPKERASMTVYGPMVFGEGFHPVSGMWMDRIKVDRCGTQVIQNVLVRARDGGQPPQMALTMPGGTAATPPMQDLVMKDVLAKFAKGTCKDQTRVIPNNTKIDKESKPRKIDSRGMLIEGAWKETWTFHACGKLASVGVEFATDGKGGLSHKVK